jgi:TolB-like protein/Tfp pilus assembly protein PilF
MVVICAAALLGYQVFRAKPTSQSSEGMNLPAKSIAVLPFENLSDDKSNAYFAEGIQDEVIARLAKAADLKVISRTSTQRFKSSPDNLPQIARQLGVMHLLEGSVQKSGDAVRVNVQLINALSDTHVWAEIYDRKLTDIFTVESEIAKKIADTLQAKLTGSEANAMVKQPTADPEAHDLYLKGRFFWNRRSGADLLRAIEQFKAAIVKDPTYAPAYAGLADSYALLPAYSAASSAESMPQARAAALKAIELDETLAEAHTSLAMTLFCYDLDFAASAAEFEKAIALNPNYATAHHWYANVTLTALQQWDRVFAEANRALELDPLSLIINADVGANLAAGRRFDDAILSARKTLQMDERFPYGHLVLGQALQLKGDLKGATAEFQRAVDLDANDTGALAYLGQAVARAGRRDEAEKILARLTEMAKSHYVGSYSFAILYLGLGDKEQATNWFERGYQDHAGTDVGFIHVDPLLDDLRGYPPFDKLVSVLLSKQKK